MAGSGRGGGDKRDDGVEQQAPTAVSWPMITDFVQGEWRARQLLVRSLTYLVRSPRTGSRGFVDELGRAVWSINPDLPLARVRTLEDIYVASMSRTSFALAMLGIAGGMALLLGVTGIYGVISYSVSQRSREIGIRIALGAQPRSVTGMFVRARSHAGRHRGGARAGGVASASCA